MVIDLFSRQVVGWSLREDMSSSIVIDALRVAWFKRHRDKQAGLCFTATREAWADSTGHRNTFNQGGVYGTTCRVDEEFNEPWSDALAGCAVTST